MPKANVNNQTSGDDRMTGGSGADTFWFNPTHGDDVITNFQPGIDSINMMQFRDGIAWHDLRNNMKQTDAGVKIDLSDWGGGTILLEGINSPNDLSRDDFTLPSASLNLTGTSADDSLYGDSDDDVISAGGGDDYIVGYTGDDRLKGGAGDDVIVGAQGDDRIEGGAGNDRLYGDGWASDDTYSDGTAASDRDTFVYTRDGGNDWIMDFKNGEDSIDLTDFSNISGFSDISATQAGNDVVIDFTDQGGGKITLQKFNLNNLDANDFIFSDDSGAVDGV